MKKILNLLLGFFSTLLLSSCSFILGNYSYTQVSGGLMDGAWFSSVATNPNEWTGNDHWFLTGEHSRHAGYLTRNLPTSDFNQLRIAGNFRVELTAQQASNSIVIEGPAHEINEIVVDYRGGEAFIHQIPDSQVNVDDVVIHIGMRVLNQLTLYGAGAFYGRDIVTPQLNISAFDASQVMLVGRVNVTSIQQQGIASISISGVDSPYVCIRANGAGRVYLSGSVGVQSIINDGSGQVKIIGAQPTPLMIHASGNSCTTLSGCLNIRKIVALGHSKVFAFKNYSVDLSITEMGSSYVGLEGNVTNLNLNLFGQSRLDAEYLHSESVYIRTQDFAHANVTAKSKIFATAGNNSSVYYYGPANRLSRYSSEYGLIIPISNVCPVPKVSLPVFKPCVWKQNVPPPVITHHYLKPCHTRVVCHPRKFIFHKRCEGLRYL